MDFTSLNAYKKKQQRREKMEKEKEGEEGEGEGQDTLHFQSLKYLPLLSWSFTKRVC